MAYSRAVNKLLTIKFHRFEAKMYIYSMNNNKMEMPKLEDFLKSISVICQDFEAKNQIPKQTINLPSQKQNITINKN